LISNLMSDGSPQHLSGDHLDRLVRSELDWGEVTQALTHLALCEKCRRRLVDAHPTAGPAILVRHLGTDRLPAIEDGAGAEEEVRRAIDAGLANVSKARRELAAADTAWADMRRLPAGRMALRLTNSPQLRTLGMAVILLEETRGCWDDDPRDAERLADLALGLLERCDGYPPKQLQDLLARAHTYRANCRRLLGRMQAAGRDLERAREHLARGSHDPLELAQVLEYESSLLRDQGSYRSAAENLQRASNLHEATGDFVAEVRMQILGALVLRDAGDPAQALEVLELVAAQHTPEEMGTENHYDLRSHKVRLLTDLDRLAEARQHLGEVRRLANRRGLPWVARVDWLEANLLQREGDVGRAEVLYRAVRDVFRARSMGYESVLAALDLATLYVEEASTAGLRALAEDLASHVLSHELHRESLAALYAFQRAALEGRATLEVIQETRHVLRRMRSSP
jgi:tetratricopeptide (TPR) repeat protein